MTGDLTRLDDAGCDVCREGWHSGRFPRLVSRAGGPINLYQCAVCDTYWLETERYARPISIDEARRLFPDSVQQ